MTNILISKDFEFEAAHQLNWHQGLCHNLHGHTYKLRVTISGKLDKNGVIMDFSVLKRRVTELVLNRHDHSFLNDFYDNPTAELMALRIFDIIKNNLPEGVVLERIELWETPTSKCEVSR